MEITNEKTAEKKKALKTIVISALVLVAALGTWYYLHARNGFCFTFAHDTQFGDKTIEKPSNAGFMGPRGITYYVPETKALQTALKKEGFYVDDFETTGGGIYLTSFFGPTTKSAVMEFQKRYGLPASGVVDNDTIDALNATYGCPAGTATSTESYSIATTTKK